MGYTLDCCCDDEETPPVETDCECCDETTIPGELIVEIPDDFENLCEDPCELDEFGSQIDPSCRECETSCSNGAGTFSVQQAHPNDINALGIACFPGISSSEGCQFNGVPCENATWYYQFPTPNEDCKWCMLIVALEYVDENTCALVAELMGPDRGEIDGSRNGILWRKEFARPVDCMAFFQAGVTVDLYDDNVGCTSIFPPCCGYSSSPITIRAAA